MKTNMTFSLEIDKSKEVSKALDSQIKTALEQCGLIAERYAMDACPVVTGRLRASITHAIMGSEGGTHQYKDNNGHAFDYKYGSVGDEKSMYLGTNVEYAPFVEEGSRGRTARHFIKYAIENHKEEYRKIIDDRLRGKA